MIDTIGWIYLIGAAVVFVFGLFLNEKVEGRVATGEPDVSSSVLMAIMWPVALLLIVIFVVVVKTTKERQND